MRLDELLSTARDAITVRRVYGDPYEKDGVTIIPGAFVAGGGGGGTGQDEQGHEGRGAGFGVRARPSGAFVLRDRQLRWQPAMDVNRLAAVIGAVLVMYLFARSRRRGHAHRHSHRHRH